MVLAEYWKLVKEEEEEALAKARNDRKDFTSYSGLQRCNLSEEEWALIRSDPEMETHILGIQAEREANAAEELQRQEVSLAADTAIVIPIETANDKVRRAKEWISTWSILQQVEHLAAQTFINNLERLGWIEEDEGEARGKVGTHYDSLLGELKSLEQEKHRVLVDGKAWASDWSAEYDRKWKEERKANEERRARILAPPYPEQGEEGPPIP